MTNVQKLIVAQRELIKVLYDQTFQGYSNDELISIKKFCRKIAKLEQKIIAEETIKK